MSNRNLLFLQYPVGISGYNCFRKFNQDVGLKTVRRVIANAEFDRSGDSLK
jgi:hypothetical protein